jgi:benzoyl-CoA 2,3-epoxidase subunit A
MRAAQDSSARGQGQKQHLIDPETCIRCNTCESRCPTGAISHDEANYVVDFAVCEFCMACVRPCPTGAIDNWVVVTRPYAVAEQFQWQELPSQAALPDDSAMLPVDALDNEASAILDSAHRGMHGPAHAPESASKPRINVFTRLSPATAIVTGNLRITDTDAASDVRHIVLDFGVVPFPFLEGQSLGVVPPGTGRDGRPHAMRLYSIASARDGERPNTNNLALTVKRIVEPRSDGSVFQGVASNWLCDLSPGETIKVVGPFGATFLMPDDPEADLLMICTGTGVSPFRGFTHRRRRAMPRARSKLVLFFGARSPEELPYFGPLQKYQKNQLDCELVYSRLPGTNKEYVQNRLRNRAEDVASLLPRKTLHLYMCGLRGLEEGVESALADIGRAYGMDWRTVREEMRGTGRLHIETY